VWIITNVNVINILKVWLVKDPFMTSWIMLPNVRMNVMVMASNTINIMYRCIYELSLCNCTLGWMGDDCTIRYQM